MHKQMNKLQLLQSEQHSLKDRKHNLSTRIIIANNAYMINNSINKDEELLNLDCFYKCMWYANYKNKTNEDLIQIISDLTLQYIQLSSKQNDNGRKILKLRGGKWSF